MSSPTSGRAWESTPSSPGSVATSSSKPEVVATAPDRGAARTGRDGRLGLVFEARGGRTVLSGRRFTLPLQALEPMDLDGDGVATLLLLNPTGGILGGDRLDTDIALGPASRVCLSTPSATRVYRSSGPPAVQRVAMRVASGATLEWVPDHLIPSPGARLRQSTEITLARDATLLYAEAWATGRVARGERWSFDLLDTSLLVRDEAGPLLRERCLVEAGPPRDGLGATEGFAYVASFVAIRPDRPSWDDLARSLRSEIAGAGPDCRAGVTLLSRGGVLARFLCSSAPVLQAVTEALWARGRREVLGRAPLRLRKL